MHNRIKPHAITYHHIVRICSDGFQPQKGTASNDEDCKARIGLVPRKKRPRLSSMSCAVHVIPGMMSYRNTGSALIVVRKGFWKQSCVAGPRTAFVRGRLGLFIDIEFGSGTQLANNYATTTSIDTSTLRKTSHAIFGDRAKFCRDPADPAGWAGLFAGGRVGKPATRT